MKRLVAIALFYLSGVTAAYATVANVSADAHVSSTLPSTNFGTRSNLAVNSTSTAYVRFDLTNVPTGTTSAQVSKATMYVYVNRVNTTGTLSLASLSSSFSELAVTYSTRPTANAVSVTSASISAAGTYVPFDVTTLVQGWVTTPASNYGVALTSSAGNLLLDSKENDLTGHAAYVDVTLVNQGPAGTNGTNGSNGATGSTGPAGPSGPTGAAGPAGAAATLPTNYINAQLNSAIACDQPVVNFPVYTKGGSGISSSNGNSFVVSVAGTYLLSYTVGIEALTSSYTLMSAGFVLSTGGEAPYSSIPTGFAAGFGQGSVSWTGATYLPAGGSVYLTSALLQNGSCDITTATISITQVQ
jgi:hypothetical protein